MIKVELKSIITSNYIRLFDENLRLFMQIPIYFFPPFDEIRKTGRGFIEIRYNPINRNIYANPFVTSFSPLINTVGRKRKMHLDYHPAAVTLFQYPGPANILPVGRLTFPFVEIIEPGMIPGHFPRS